MTETNLNKKAFLSGSWYAISNIFLRSIAIITTPIFTRLLTPSDFGIISNFTAWSSILVVFINLSMTYSIGNAKLYFKKEFDSFIASIQLLSNLLAILFFIIIYFFSEPISSITDLSVSILLIMVVYMFFLPTLDYIQAKYRYKFLYKSNIFIAVFNTLTSVLFSFILISIFNDNRVIGRLIGIVLPVCILGLFYNVKLLLDLSKDFKIIINHWKFALKLSLPMIPHALSMILLNQIDRIQIMQYCGSTDAGLYSFGYSYALILSIALNAISQAWVPWLYERYDKKEYKIIRIVNDFMMFSVSIATILFILISPEVLSVLGGKNFSSAQIVIIPLTIGFIYQFTYGNYTNLELYHGKSIIIGVASLLAATLNFILNMFLIPVFGYQLAAYTTLIGYLVLLILHYICFKAIVSKRIFNNARTFCLLILLTIICFSINLIINYMIIRYVLFMIISIFYILMTIKFVNKNKKIFNK